MRPLTSSMIRVCTIYRSSAQFRLSSAEPLKRPLLVSEGAATYPVLWSSAAAKTRFIVCSIRTSSARRIDDITLGACLSTPTLHACLQFVRSILFRQMDGRRRSPLYLNLAATTDDFPFDAKIFVDSRRNHPATRPSKINQWRNSSNQHLCVVFGALGGPRSTRHWIAIIGTYLHTAHVPRVRNPGDCCIGRRA